MYRILIIILLYALTYNFSLSQDTIIGEQKVKILPFPVFGYSPETRTYVGAVTLFTINLYNDSITRTSNTKFEINYSQNKQVIIESNWNYFFREEKWFTKGQIHYSKYPDFYYGIGSDTPLSNKLLYNSNRFLFEAFLLKKFQNNIFTGLNFKYFDYRNVSYADSLIAYPELVNGSDFGVGYSILIDKRNNLLTPSKGSFVYLNTTYNLAKENFWEVTLDLRYYHSLKNRLTFAFRLINDFNLGNPPFYDYAFLGGDKFVRGYTYGRYRDNNLSSVQIEIRYPIIWRFGIASFGGLSNLYSDFRFGNTRYNYGGGIRFLVDKKEKTNLRLDYAVGDGGNSGFYVAFGESF